MACPRRILALGVLVAVACGEDLPFPIDTDTETGSTGPQADDDGDPTTMTTVQPSTSGVDDTTTGVDESSTGDESTGPATQCGNGIVEDDETCDDDNTLNGDACYANCTLPFEIAWTVSHNSGPQVNDFANAIVLDASGAIFVAGSISSATTDADIVIQQFTPDGRPGWSYTFDEGLGADEFAYGVSWLGTDLVVGGVSQIDSQRDALVVRVDPSDGSTVWAVYIDGPADVDDGEFVDDVAVAPDGTIVVGGALTVEDDLTDAWLAALSPSDGSIVWETFFAGEFGGDDWVEKIAIDSAGSIHVIGYQQVSQPSSSAWHRSYDADGMLTGEHLLKFFPQDIAADDAGNVVLAGWEVPGGTGGDMALYFYDASFTEQWVTYVDGPSHQFDVLRGVAFGEDGSIYATGLVTVVGQQDDYWAGRFSATGELLWSDQYNNRRLNISEAGNSLALDAAGDLIVVGRENQLGQGVNIFARKYIQFPPP